MQLSYSRCPNKRGGLEPKPIAQTNPNSPRTGNDAGVKRNKKDKYCKAKYFFVIVIVICLPTEHLGVLKSLLKRVRVLPDRIRISKRWFLRIGKNRSTRRNTSRCKGEKEYQTQPTYGVLAGILTPGDIEWRRVLSPLRHPQQHHWKVALRSFRSNGRAILPRESRVFFVGFLCRCWTLIWN